MAKIEKSGNVEDYLKLKGWDYRINGDQAVVEQCPICLGDGWKFFINVNNFLYDCKHGSCMTKGNERTLKNSMGDRMENVTNHMDSGEVKREGMIDVETAHSYLMDNQPLLDYLQDDRGWNVETIVQMKLGITNRYIREENSEVPCFTYPYYTGKNCTFVKFRTIPPANKNFASLQGWDVPLYNANCIHKGMEHLIICEGESDTISTMCLGEPNVVGVPGAGLKKVTWDRLLLVAKKKYLLFDNDRAGQEGAKSFAHRFGVDEFYNIVLPEFDLIEPITNADGEVRTKGKDITEWIAAGNTMEDLKFLMRDAEPFDVEGVTSLENSLEALARDMEERGTNLPRYDTPWEEVNRCMGGAEDSHLVVIQAPKKTGKTTFAMNWADYLVSKKGVNVYFECLEMSDKQLARKWASFKLGIEDTAGPTSQMTPELIRESKKIEQDREFHLSWAAGNYKRLDELFDKWRAAIRRYDVKVIFFDNLQALTDIIHNTREDGGRPAFISKITKRMKAFAMEMNVLVVLIVQTKRLDEDAIATAASVEGSSSSEADCDTMMIMNRTKQLQLKKGSDLTKTQVDATGTLDPRLYIEIGLSRYAPGGLAKVYIDGAISLVRNLSGDEMVTAAHAVATEAEGVKLVRRKPRGIGAAPVPAAAVVVTI